MPNAEVIPSTVPTDSVARRRYFRHTDRLMRDDAVIVVLDEDEGIPVTGEPRKLVAAAPGVVMLARGGTLETVPTRQVGILRDGKLLTAASPLSDSLSA